MNPNRVREYAILLIFIFLVVLYHIFGYTGHFGFDDLHYAELANDLLLGTIDFEDHFSYRLPVILFTALFYLIFGISDLGSSFPAILITISILLIVFNILREQGPGVLFIGLLLTTLSNWFLFYSDKLMPDIYVALSVIWALAIIHRHKFKSGKSNTARHAFLLAVSLLFGFMSKGTIVLMAPLLLYLILTDMVQKRELRFWFYSLISGIVLMSLYLCAIWILTGDLFKRFEAIASNSYLNLCSYDQQTLKILLKRIFFGFFELSIFQTLATGFIFIFAILFQRKGLRILRMDNSFSFFMVSAILLFLSSSFMSISLNSYSPMCLDPRHYLFLVPVAAVPAATIIAEFLENKKAGIQIIASLFCITVLSFFLQGDSFWKLYLPLTVLFAFYFFVRPGKQLHKLFILLFAAILLLLPMNMISYALKVEYREQKEVLLEQVIRNNQDRIIVSNEVQKRLLEYYNGFRKDQIQRFFTYEEFESDRTKEVRPLLLLNWHTRYLSGMMQQDLPVYARNIPAYIEPVYLNERLDLVIYEMKDLPLPDPKPTSLVTTLNDFERPAPFWKQNEKDISSQIKYGGTRSNRVSEYSSTFEYPLDSLGKEPGQDLLVHTSLFCFAEDKTKARIVISLENDSGIPFWEALEMNKYLKAFSNWWPIAYEVTIPRTHLKQNSRLKIYVWKTDQSTLYIDDFHVKILAFSSGLKGVE